MESTLTFIYSEPEHPERPDEYNMARTKAHMYIRPISERMGALPLLTRVLCMFVVTICAGFPSCDTMYALTTHLPTEISAPVPLFKDQPVLVMGSPAYLKNSAFFRS